MISRYQIHIIPRTLHFKQPAGTSRGVYTTRKVWYVVLKERETSAWGIGECAPLPDLSCDAIPNLEEKIEAACRGLLKDEEIDCEALRAYPSILFALETAWQQLYGAGKRLWDTSFSRGEKGIPINGLVWMGDYATMRERVQAKLEAGFRCIKLKIGAIHFEDELALLAMIRNSFPSEKIQLRVDANGAFSPEEALDKLNKLAAFQLHSIEQPIRARQWKEMASLCTRTPLPIALDEELIGVNIPSEKAKMLDEICPQYIILKPSLHGGLSGAKEWIDLAKERGIDYWITSALESNIGLNAIAQWTATFEPILPQGLGTGMLFTDNVEMPLSIKGDELFYLPQLEQKSEMSKLLALCNAENEVKWKA